MAYAPYSKFHVGAAVLGDSGQIYGGANVENASFGLSICAERVALATARAAGESSMLAIAIACVDAANASLEERMPCGACRQWLQELAPDAVVIVAPDEVEFKVSDILPHPFKLTP